MSKQQRVHIILIFVETIGTMKGILLLLSICALLGADAAYSGMNEASWFKKDSTTFPDRENAPHLSKVAFQALQTMVNITGNDVLTRLVSIKKGG